MTDKNDAANLAPLLKGVKLTPETRAIAELLVRQFAPETAVIGGKIVDVREDLLAIIADGDIDAADVFEQIARMKADPPSKRGGGEAGGGEPAGGPHGSGEGDEATRIGRIKARVLLFGPKRGDKPLEPLEYTLEDTDVKGAKRIVLDRAAPNGDRQTSLDDGSKVRVEIDVFDQHDNPLRIDLDPSETPAGQVNHPEFLGRFRFTAYDRNGDLLAMIGGHGMDEPRPFERNGTRWLDPNVSANPGKGEGFWRRSGGMVAEVVVRERCSIVVSHDDILSNMFITPEVR